MPSEPAAGRAEPTPAAGASTAAGPDSATDPTADGAGPAAIVVQRRIEWSDTDASGNYHNTTVIRLLETAESLLLARLGFLHDVWERLPRVRLEIDFRRPLRFHELVEVQVRVVALGRTSITYHLEIRREGEVCVQARVVAVLITEVGGEAVPWPPEYRSLLLTSGPQPPERLVTGAPDR
jgi:YbgC/YbaW family acyl-CoA thioester hydrolase